MISNTLIDYALNVPYLKTAIPLCPYWQLS